MEQIDNLASYFFQFIEINKKALPWDEINEKIKILSKNGNVSDALKLILSSTGSVTRSLEILTGKSVKVETIFQKIAQLNGKNRELKEFLTIGKDEELNFREVWLRNGIKKHVYAVSLTPVKNLEPDFKDDLLKADIPIGKLINKHNIECRREIYQISEIEYRNIKKMGIIWPDLSNDSKIPYRNYNIISKGVILMFIFEFFYPFL